MSYIIFIIINILSAQNTDEKIILKEHFTQFAEIKKVEFTEEFIYTVELSSLYLHDSLLIRKFDYDFNQIGKTINVSYDEYGVDINEVYFDGDTLVLIGHVIGKWDSPLKYDFHLFVRKYLDGELIYDNIALNNLRISTYYNTITPRIYYINNNIFSIFRNPYIGVIKYDIGGNIIKIDTLINDSISNGESVGAIGAYGIIENNDLLYCFLYKKNSDKFTHFYNIYNKNFEFIESDTIYKNKTVSLTEFDLLNFNNRTYISYGEYFHSARLKNVPSRELFEITEDGVIPTNKKLGINYPDRINSLKKFNDKFIAVGSYHSTERTGGSFALIQLLDEDLNPIDFCTFEILEENSQQEIIDFKILNENEIIVVGKISAKGMFFKKIDLSKLNVIKELNVKNLYPNPSSDIININYENLNTKEIQIFDLNLNKIDEFVSFDSIVIYDVSGYNVGTYIIKTTIDNEIIWNKFIKK